MNWTIQNNRQKDRLDEYPLTVTEMQQIIDNAFKEDENSKDRFNDVFGSIISALVMAVLFKK